MASQIEYGVDIAGVDRASVTVSWAPVFEAEDGSEIDIQSYVVETSPDAVAWKPAATAAADSVSAVLRDLAVPSVFWVRVRAVGVNGVPADPSEVEYVELLPDVTPPPVASTPSVSARLGVLSVTWNGLFVAPGVRPTDFRWVQVHVSSTSGFTPSAATLQGTLSDAGTLAVGGLTYGTYFVVLVATDVRGNVAAPSTQVSASVDALVVTSGMISEIDGAKVITKTITGTKIGDSEIKTVNLAANSVAADKIVSAAVTTAKLDALAVTADKIAVNAITADKITAGAVTAIKISGDAIDGKVITGATLRTAASGARIEQNTSGIFQYNASNAVVSSWTPSAFNLTGGTISGAVLYGATIGSGSFSTGIAGVGGYPTGTLSSDQAGTVNGRVRLTYQFSGALNDRFDITGSQAAGKSILSIRGPRNAATNGGLSNGITGIDMSGDQLQSSFQVSKISNGDTFRSGVTLGAAYDVGVTDYVGTYVQISAGASAATIDYPAIDVNDYANSGYVSVRSAGFRVFDGAGVNRFEVQSTQLSASVPTTQSGYDTWNYVLIGTPAMLGTTATNTSFFSYKVSYDRTVEVRARFSTVGAMTSYAGVLYTLPPELRSNAPGNAFVTINMFAGTGTSYANIPSAYRPQTGAIEMLGAALGTPNNSYRSIFFSMTYTLEK